MAPRAPGSALRAGCTRKSRPFRAGGAVYRARVFQIIGVFAGEAGLLGACSVYSDTLLVRDRLEVLAQQIPPEVAVEIAPHGMDVIAVVLGVVVLDQKRGPLDAVVVLLSPLRLARPGERDFLEPCFAKLCDPIGGAVV